MDSAVPVGVPATRRRQLIVAIEVAASGLLGWLIVSLTLGLLGLHLDGQVGLYTALLAVLALPALAFWQWREEGQGAGLASGVGAALALLVLALSLWGVSGFYDKSWDGVSYHQPAIIHMVEGWPDFPRRLEGDSPVLAWLDYYAKSPWVLGASLYALTGSIEQGLALQYVLMAMAALWVAAALLRTAAVPSWAILPLALLAALNPVAVYQSLSFYVDGQLTSLLVALAAVLILLFHQVRRRHLVAFAALIVLAMNVKHTGIAYAGLLILAMLAMLWRWRRAHLQRVFAAAAVGGLLGALAFGYSPYVTNALNYGHPLYPFMGVKADAAHQGLDMVDSQRPAGFSELNRLQRLARSSVARPTLTLGTEPSMRWPMQLSAKDLLGYTSADIRLGGWGGLFLEALLLALLGMLALRGIPPATRAVGLALLGVCVVATLISPDPWWARYSPLWFFVPLIVAGLLAASRLRVSRAIAAALLLLLAANIGGVMAGFYPAHRAYARLVDDVLAQLKATGGVVQIHFGHFPANRLRLEKAGLRYLEAKTPEELRCPQPQRIFQFEGQFCLLR